MTEPLKRWKQDPRFLELHNTIIGKTLIDIERQYMLFQLAEYMSRRMAGVVAEVGVYKGGSAKILVECFKLHRILLFDTFAGMPSTTKIDLHYEGQYADTSEEAVREFLGEQAFVEYRKGKFPDTAVFGDGPFCFVHADADIYQSTVEICEYFVPKMIKGGMIVFDDYGARSCPGCKKAVDERIEGGVIYLPTGQALFIK